MVGELQQLQPLALLVVHRVHHNEPRMQSSPCHETMLGSGNSRETQPKPSFATDILAGYGKLLHLRRFPNPRMNHLWVTQRR